MSVSTTTGSLGEHETGRGRRPADLDRLHAATPMPTGRSATSTSRRTPSSSRCAWHRGSLQARHRTANTTRRLTTKTDPSRISTPGAADRRTNAAGDEAPVTAGQAQTTRHRPSKPKKAPVMTAPLSLPKTLDFTALVREAVSGKSDHRFTDLQRHNTNCLRTPNDSAPRHPWSRPKWFLRNLQ